MFGQGRPKPTDHEPHCRGDAIRIEVLVSDHGHRAKRKQHSEQDAGSFVRVNVRPHAPELLLSRQVGGEGLGRTGRQRGTGSRQHLPAMRGELGVGGHRELQGHDLVPQARELYRGIGQIVLDRAPAGPVRKRP